MFLDQPLIQSLENLDAQSDSLLSESAEHGVSGRAPLPTPAPGSPSAGWAAGPAISGVGSCNPLGASWPQLVPAQISQRCTDWGPVLALLCDRSACWDLAKRPQLQVQSSNVTVLTSWGCGILWGMTELTRAKCLT